MTAQLQEPGAVGVAERESIAGDAPRAPAVTIGIPAYNEARYIRETIESLLAQTFDDFELLVSDNASTDGTAEIVAEMAEADGRIRLVRQPRNVGSMRNIHRLVRHGQGDLFLLAAGHDCWSPEALERLKAALDECPKAVLAFPDFPRIDRSGDGANWHGRSQRLAVVDTTSMTDPVKRFNVYMWASQWPMYGLARRDAWLATSVARVGGCAPGAILVGEMAVLGSFVQVPEAKLFCRDTHEEQPPKERTSRRQAACYAKERVPPLPHWRLPFAFLRSLWSVPLKRARRRRTRMLLFVSALSAFIRYRRGMWRDIFG
ncbi:MAG: glycosyltransferase family 2 protein [Planctomycetales bacterium]